MGYLGPDKSSARNGAIYGDKGGVYCQNRIFDAETFGDRKIVVERPDRDEQGNIVMKRGKPAADASLQDTENVPMTEDISAGLQALFHS